MLQDFRAPSGKLVLLTHVGGFVSAILLLTSLQWLADAVNRQPLGPSIASPQPANSPLANAPPANAPPVLSVAQLDQTSLQIPASNPRLVATAALPLGTAIAPITPADQPLAQQLARQSWQYFAQNTNGETGLVSGASDQSSVTMADVASHLAALVSARELAVLPAAEFDQRLEKLLTTLERLPLYQDTLPNHAYHPATLIPIVASQPELWQETGWSPLDLGRLARWLKVVSSRYPQWQPRIDGVWQSWQVDQLVQDGQLYEVTPQNGDSTYQQQGRLGYESYAAYGLQLWGLAVAPALDVTANVQLVSLYGQSVPIDARSDQASSPNVSDPYIWDGIETGFQSLPKGYADRILAAQMARYQATQKLTAVADDRLDRAPFALTNTFYAQQKPWQSLNQQHGYADFRFVSSKAAIGWHVLYRNDYTQKLYQLAQGLGSDRGMYSGFYETLNQPNQALTADTNGLILSSLLYQQLQQPILTWAGVKPPN
jgi:Protein of unknown function (DUF3131)